MRQRVSFDLIYSTQNQNPIFFSVIAIPNGEIKSNQHGVLAIFIDITDQEITKNKLNDAEKENTELKAALDAHAIVAVTNASGVITNVATETAFEQVNSAVVKIGDMSTQIATATEEQRAVVEEMNRNIHAIDDQTEQAASISRTNTQLGKEMAEASTSLKQSVQMFHL